VRASLSHHAGKQRRTRTNLLQARSIISKLTKKVSDGQTFDNPSAFVHKSVKKQGKGILWSALIAHCSIARHRCKIGRTTLIAQTVPN
jgi:hypothetical protein